MEFLCLSTKMSVDVHKKRLWPYTDNDSCIHKLHVTYTNCILCIHISRRFHTAYAQNWYCVYAELERGASNSGHTQIILWPYTENHSCIHKLNFVHTHFSPFARCVYTNVILCMHRIGEGASTNEVRYTKWYAGCTKWYAARSLVDIHK